MDVVDTPKSERGAEIFGEMIGELVSCIQKVNKDQPDTLLDTCLGFHITKGTIVGKSMVAEKTLNKRQREY